ncbi:hypothetical protein GCM10010145_62160 [Streptomyces ruber]|uniref:Uncharacterized protein n=2 Tax=Streptomyces TaxID=1883 RepID=A0A918EXX3_9ACTN|nr:hypothetical protein GCM10010145_62160 [Streptomyces ruber]
MARKSPNNALLVLSCTAVTCLVGVLATVAGLFDWAVRQSAVLFAAAGLVSGSIAVARRKSGAGRGGRA